MRIAKSSPIKKFVGLHFGVGCCNMSCSYCYIGKTGNKIQDIPYTIDEMRRAFAKKRLGGTAFINICSDGETLIHPMMVDIIRMFLDEGHYVMLVTNGTVTRTLKQILELQDEQLARIFFKISFHYEELLKMNMLDKFFENVNMLAGSPCSITVEYITVDETLQHIEGFKKTCMEGMGALPQINMPRDERKQNLGLFSKYSWEKYLKKIESLNIPSKFFDFRVQYFGRRYKQFCFLGGRYIWVNMKTGYAQQCYRLPPIQNFMKDLNSPVRWIPVGNHCPEAHCYVCYTFFPLGCVDTPEYGKYRPTYYEIRNRKDNKGREWIKPTYKEAFECGVERKEFSSFEKKMVNLFNQYRKWYYREFGL